MNDIKRCPDCGKFIPLYKSVLRRLEAQGAPICECQTDFQ